MLLHALHQRLGALDAPRADPGVHDEVAGLRGDRDVMRAHFCQHELRLGGLRRLRVAVRADELGPRLHVRPAALHEHPVDNGPRVLAVRPGRAEVPVEALRLDEVGVELRQRPPRGERLRQLHQRLLVLHLERRVACGAQASLRARPCQCAETTLRSLLRMRRSGGAHGCTNNNLPIERPLSAKRSFWASAYEPTVALPDPRLVPFARSTFASYTYAGVLRPKVMLRPRAPHKGASMPQFVRVFQDRFSLADRSASGDSEEGRLGERLHSAEEIVEIRVAPLELETCDTTDFQAVEG